MHLATFMLRSRRLRGKKEERDRARENEEIIDQLQIIWCHTDAVYFLDNLVKPQNTPLLHFAPDTFRFCFI